MFAFLRGCFSNLGGSAPIAPVILNVSIDNVPDFVKKSEPKHICKFTPNGHNQAQSTIIILLNHALNRCTFKVFDNGKLGFDLTAL